jgi:Spy/CpxP family protein refolding chaperone
MVSTSRLKAYAVLAGMFLLGAAAGGGASYAHAQRRYAVLVSERPEFLESRRLGALARRLSMDGDQRDRVRAIMERHAEERRLLTRQMYERCGDSLRQNQAAVDAEVRGVLSADQRQKYDELAGQRRDRAPYR